MKKLIAKTILRWQMPRMQHDAHPFNRLMADAIQLQLGRINDEEFRMRLDCFYCELDVEAIKRDISFAAKAARLDRPGGYKIDVSSLVESGASTASPGRFDFWARRFSLLRHLGVRSDVLILRQGETIPPHGHHRVVSGFYVLEGEVAVRHYDRVRETETGLIVKKTIDAEMGPGGYTTNSESVHNIHWLQGIAEKTFLFRVTIVDTPAAQVETKHSDSRLYIDPTGEPDANGLITAPFISDTQAKQLRIPIAAAARS